MPYIPQYTPRRRSGSARAKLAPNCQPTPRRGGGEAVRDAAIALHRHAVQITHVGKYVGGGALKNSHRMQVKAGLRR